MVTMTLQRFINKQHHPQYEVIDQPYNIKHVFCCHPLIFYLEIGDILATLQQKVFSLYTRSFTLWSYVLTEKRSCESMIGGCTWQEVHTLSYVMFFEWRNFYIALLASFTSKHVSVEWNCHVHNLCTWFFRKKMPL